MSVTALYRRTRRPAALFVMVCGLVGCSFLLWVSDADDALRHALAAVLLALGVAGPAVAAALERPAPAGVIGLLFPAAAGNAAVVGSDALDFPQTLFGHLAVAVSLALCVLATLLRAERTASTSRNRF
ncbi:hypothetical protein CUT44_21350 [Streptomyces carminius]|uniref:Uncharacterized protein n=1 Tax=Streptomyces carminius TaxID=2665496 RepID=A0A2M8LV15_9ACTN|nr:hypothetical protein [Streptomyces carminius]PJE95803.1 hypothetical protein CUT44_21350 [Streptomyces carminius]